MAADLAREAQIQAGSLRQLSTWMLTNDHDIRGPDVQDLKDAADLIERLMASLSEARRALRRVQVSAENMYPRTDCTRLQFREAMAEIAADCGATLQQEG